LFVAREVWRKEFECYGALEAGVLGFVDHAHTPPTQFFKDLIM
jgi:hypothetical protein